MSYIDSIKYNDNTYDLRDSNAIHSVNVVTRFSGMKISILGDSISTYTGYNPTGYPGSGYPGRGVTSVDEVWWMKVINASGAALEINASWGGSCASNVRASLGYPTFYDRRNSLGSPDLIFVELGTNDSSEQAPLGNYDYETEYANLSESTFRTAYIKGVKALENIYQNAKIVLVITNMTDDYANSIKNIGRHLGHEFIDARGYATNDELHPNLQGMRDVSSKVLYSLNGEIKSNSGSLLIGGRADGKNTFYLEEDDAGNGRLFVKADRFSVFANDGTTRVNTEFSVIIQDLNEEPITSPKGIENCLEIPNDTALVFDSVQEKWLFKNRYEVAGTDVLLFFNAWGRAENLHPSLNHLRTMRLDQAMPYVNVKNYGAKGDGVADDTQAIQNAIDSIKDSGGTIFVPSGTYLLKTMPWNSGNSNVSACLHLYNDQTLELENGAILKRGSNSVNHLIFTHNDDNATVYDGARNIIIRGGTIDENNIFNTNDTAVNITHAFNIIVENVTFKNSSGTWHYIEINSSRRVKIANCNFLSGSNSEDIQLDAAIGGGNLGQNDETVCKDIDISYCYFDSGAHPGIGNHSDYAHTNIRIHDCVFYNNNSRGAIAWTASTQNVDAYNNTFYQNNYGMNFDAAQLSSTFHDNRLHNVATVVNNCTEYNNTIDGVYTSSVSTVQGTEN